MITVAVHYFAYIKVSWQKYGTEDELGLKKHSQLTYLMQRLV
jgi:hypothetical protein